MRTLETAEDVRRARSELEESRRVAECHVKMAAESLQVAFRNFRGAGAENEARACEDARAGLVGIAGVMP